MQKRANIPIQTALITEESNRHAARCKELALLINKLNALEPALTSLESQGICLDPSATKLNNDIPKIAISHYLDDNFALYDALIRVGFIETKRASNPDRAGVLITLTLDTINHAQHEAQIVMVELPISCPICTYIDSTSQNRTSH